MSAQWKAVSKMDIKKFVSIFSQQRNLKRLRTLGQALGFSLKGFCIGVTGGSLVGYPAAVSGKSMQPVFNFPTRREPTLWQFSCLPVPDEPFSDNMWEEEEIEEWDEEDGVEGVPFFLPLLLELVKSLWTQVPKEHFFLYVLVFHSTPSYNPRYVSIILQSAPRTGCGWTRLLQEITNLVRVTSLSMSRPRTPPTAWSNGW